MKYFFFSLCLWVVQVFTHLHLVDDVQEELVGILLPVGGKLRVSLADQGLQHPGGDAFLLVLEQEHTNMEV